MTDKARELLERVLAGMDRYGDINYKTLEEIRAYLAEPEVKSLSEQQEALKLAESLEAFRSWPDDERDIAAAKELRRLYMENKKHHQNKSKPISPIEINKEYLYKIDESTLSAPMAFALGVRFAEKHHGIGDNNENTNT